MNSPHEAELKPQPNAFLVGAPKCGTTSLASYLANHPNAFVCEPKEPNYWGDDLKTDPSQNGIFLSGQNAYLSLFAASNPRIHSARCDASTTYIWSDVAVHNIMKHYPNAKIILMLRNPVELALSLYREERFSLAEDVTDFWTAWRLQEKRLSGLLMPKHCVEPRKLQYRAIASVGSHVCKLKKLVPEEQRLIILLEDMVANPEMVWSKVQQFLGLPLDGRNTFPVVNSAKYHSHPRLAELVLRPPQFLIPIVNVLRKVAWVSGLRGIRSSFFKKRAFKLAKDLSHDKAIYRLLLPEFEEEIKLLESAIDRDLSSWREKYAA